MKYNQLGKAGIKISQLSLGSWITFSKQMDINLTNSCIKYAVDNGINFFDTAEVYEDGRAETLLGDILKQFRRESLVISTKIFFGGEGPNDKGLSRKHLREGLKNSLKRLQMDYVDLVFCHRPDPNTPIEETVLAMDYIVRSGYAFYWGTSEWSAEQIDNAFTVAKQLNCIPPTMEQPQYNMFHRYKVEKEYKPLYRKFSLGLTIWSPLASGILTSKYNKNIPGNSRLGQEEWLRPKDMNEKVMKVKKLEVLANQLGCSMTQFALAWCLSNPQVSTVILGVSKLEQLIENLQSINTISKITEDIKIEINNILL